MPERHASVSECGSGFFAARELAYAANGWLRRVLALIQMGDKFDRGKTFAGTVGP